MRRSRLRLIARSAGYGMAAACAGAWVVARVCSDRYAWSQPISWIPTPLLAAPIWVAVAGAAVRERNRRVVLRQRGSGAPLRSIGAALRGVSLLGLGVVTLWHLAFVELGVHRAAGAGSESGSVRLAFWNQAGRELGDISPAFAPLEPDIFVLANGHSETRTDRLASGLAPGSAMHAASGWPFDLLSRSAIRRSGSTALGLDGRSRDADGATREDPGWASFYEIETQIGPLTLWVIDLPSDPAAPRHPLAGEAGRAIASLGGAARVVGEDGARTFERGDRPGFPRPDIVVGDFNIPRGSASLREFLRASGAGDMRSAFDEAGWGWERTWPRRWPVWAIDQCFVGRRVRAISFDAVDPGMGGHRALVVGLAAR